MRSVVFLTIVRVILFSCRKRIDDPKLENTDVRITLDWESLQGNISKPEYIKALFFSVDTDKVYERYIDSDDHIISLPKGDYNVIFFNWRVNEGAQTIQFRGKTFDTFEAYTDPISKSDVLSKPDSYLFAWSSGDVIIHIGESCPTKSEDAVNSMDISMSNIIKSYMLEVDIENHKSITAVQSRLSGARGGFFLGSNKPTDNLIDMEMDCDIKSVDDKGKASFYINYYGKQESDPLNISFKTANSNGVMQQFDLDIKDVVNKIDKGEIDNSSNINISNPDAPVVVEPSPPVDNDGFVPPNLGDWESGNDLDINI